MAFFLKHVPYATWHVHLVEAGDVNEALHEKDGEYLGFYDSWSNENCEVFGPFDSKEAALASDKAWVEGR